MDVQTTPRAQWLKIISRFPVEPSPEHRRSEVRHDVALGSVQVAYEKNGRPTLAGGKVLNVSAQVRPQQHDGAVVHACAQ
nr:hypothetical protein [Phycisphaerae bacterium]